MAQEPSNPSYRGVLSTRREQFQAPQDWGMKRPLARRASVPLAELQRTPKSFGRRVRRGLHRTWMQSLAGLTLLLAFGQGAALASTIFVGGPCTLADAVTSANQDLALGGCTTGSGRDSIVLPARSIQAVRTLRPSGLIIRTPITIVGNGSTIRRIGGDSDSRVFTVTASALTLQSVAVSRSDDDDLDGDDDRGRGRGRGGDDDGGLDDNPSGDDDNSGSGSGSDDSGPDDS